MSLQLPVPRGCWASLTTSGDIPRGRSGHIAALHKDRYMYIFGGHTGQDVTNDLYFLDLFTLQWIRVHGAGPQGPKLPAGRCSHTGVLDPLTNLLYIHGGSGYIFGDSNKNDTYSFNLTTNEWEQVRTSGSLPPPRYGHSCILHKNSLVFFGGTQGMNYINKIHILRLSTKVWGQIFPGGDLKPEPRYKHSALLMGDEMLIIGGYSNDKQKIQYGDFWKLDLTQQIWSKEAETEIPEGRFSHSLELYQNNLYLFGGNIQVRRGDMWKYSFKKKIWREYPQIGAKPIARSFHSSVFCNGYIILFGGNTGQEKVNDCSAFRLADHIPKFESPLAELQKHIFQPSQLTDIKISCRESFFFSQLAVLKVRVPLIAQNAIENPDPARESLYFLQFEHFSAEAVRELLHYIYSDQIEGPYQLKLQLLSIACMYGIPALVNRLFNYFSRIISHKNCVQIANYLHLHLEQGLLHRQIFRQNVQMYCDRNTNQKVTKYLSQNLQISRGQELLCIYLRYIINKAELLKKQERLQMLDYQLLQQVQSKTVNSGKSSQASKNVFESEIRFSLELLLEDPNKDYTIETEGQTLQIHKFMAISRSDFFQNLIQSGFSPQDKQFVSLQQIPFEFMEKLIKYIYLGQIALQEFQTEEAVELILHADFLQIKDTSLRDLVGALVSQDLSHQNVFQFLENSERLNATVMKHMCLQYIMDNFQELVNCEELYDCSKEMLVELLRWKATTERS